VTAGPRPFDRYVMLTSLFQVDFRSQTFFFALVQDDGMFIGISRRRGGWVRCDSASFVFDLLDCPAFNFPSPRLLTESHVSPASMLLPPARLVRVSPRVSVRFPRGV